MLTDQEFEPGSASSDDEETIAKEEQYATDQVCIVIDSSQSIVLSLIYQN